jgi:hypothetical protein
VGSLRPRGRQRLRCSVWAGGLLAAAACTASSTGESVGALEVLATTSGANPDLDGYRVDVEGEPARAVAPGGSTPFPALPAGEHRVTLSGVAANCAVADSAVRRVVIEAGQTDTIAFSITCDSTSGSVQVRTMTSGEDLDPNGYAVLVDDVPVATVPDTGVTEVPVAAVRHQVALAGVTPNCIVAGDNPRSVDVGTGVSVPIAFAIQCAQAPLGPEDQISFSTERRQFPPEVVLANADGTGVRTLIGERGPAAWSPDGSSVAVSTGSGILVGPVDRNGVLGVSHEIVPGLFITGLAWSPDGARLALTDNVDGECDELSTVQPDGNDQQFLTFCDLYSGNPSWSPDGATIALSAFPFDVLNHVVLLYDASGSSDPRTLDTGSLDAATAAWSPDGSRIAFASRGAEGVEYDVYVVDLDGAHLTRLTRAPGDDVSPAWSPDGTKIAFVSHRDGNAEIYVMAADGSDPTRITNNPAADTLPAWRHDDGL